MELILETLDGFRKRVSAEEPEDSILRWPIVSKTYVDPSDAMKKRIYQVSFEPTGEFEQETLPDGTIAGIQIWRER